MDDNSVVNLNERRNEMVEKRRREFERIVFDNFLGVYTLLDETHQLIPIKMVNISESGCMFQIPTDSKFLAKFKRDHQLDIRFYFTKEFYLLVNVRIKYSKEFSDMDQVNYRRFGCEFDKKSKSFDAFALFINFMQKFAEQAISDKNEGNKVLHF